MYNIPLRSTLLLYCYTAQAVRQTGADVPVDATL